MSVLTLDHVLAEVMLREPAAGIRLVGVDGPSGSGKSTLAKRLAGRGGAPLIEIDDFLGWHNFAGWWPRFESQVLGPLLAGQDATYEVRDWINDEFGDGLDGWKTAPWSPVVIMEGVTCTRGAVTDRLAYGIWVEAPANLRLRRGIARDGASHRRLWENWMETEQQFFAHDGTRGRADLRVNGSPGLRHDPETELVTLD